MRYCYPDGRLNMFCKNHRILFNILYDHGFNAIEYFKNLFYFFGHWSSLKEVIYLNLFFSLDAGCCWGGELTYVGWEDKKWFHNLLSK